MSVRTRAWGTLTGLLLIHLGAVVWWIASASDAANLQVQWTFALLVALLRDRGGEGCERIRFSSAILNSLAISRTDVSGTTVTTSVVMTSAAVNMASSHGFAREWPPPRHVRARTTLPGGRLIKRLLTRLAGYSAPARQLHSLTGAIPDAFYGGLGMRPASR